MPNDQAARAATKETALEQRIKGIAFAAVKGRSMIELACAALIAAALTALPGAAASAPGGSVRQADLAAVAGDVIQRTNAFRARNGLAPLTRDDTLAAAAQRFADYMAKTDRYGHEADGRPPAERVKEAGYSYCLVAENIAYQMSSAGFASDELAMRLVEGWEQSPGHRRNMLFEPAVHIGVGIAQAPRSRRYYAVQLFARPSGAATRFEIANRAGATVRYALDGERFTLAPRVTRTHRGCFEGTLQVQWPDGGSSSAIEPRDGARYVVARDGEGRWQIAAQ
jgi:uncharacterized protein YkwD